VGGIEVVSYDNDCCCSFADQLSGRRCYAWPLYAALQSSVEPLTAQS